MKGEGLATRTLTWNADNMPLTVSRNGTVTTTLTYDGNGARAKKVAGGITTYYVSSDYEIKNGVATKYVFAGNMRVASVEGTNINSSKIFHKDHLGSSTAITDNTGADLETSEYMPFGVQRSHSGANASGYKYTDQELDNESGLYNYDARMYDPVIGRFISADTVIQSPYNPQTLNRYSYCVNNPLIYTDPSGHVVIPGPLLQLALAMAKEEEAKREKEVIKPGEGKFGPEGDKLLKEIEKLRLKPYDDRTGKEITEWNERATIGFGHLITERQWDKYKNGIKDKAEADTIFNDDLAVAVKAVNKGLKVNVSQNQFDALVLLAFNIGTSKDRFPGSSVLKMINDPNAKTDYATIESAWKAWDGPGEVSIKGLVNRRASEWNIYSKGVYKGW